MDRVMELTGLWNRQGYGMGKIMKWTGLWNGQGYGMDRIMEMENNNEIKMKQITENGNDKGKFMNHNFFG